MVLLVNCRQSNIHGVVRCGAWTNYSACYDVRGLIAFGQPVLLSATSKCRLFFMTMTFDSFAV